MSYVLEMAQRGRKLRKWSDEFQGVSQTPHPQSLGNDDAAEFCRLPMDEQLTKKRKRRFDDKLCIRLADLEDEGSDVRRMEAFARKHYQGFDAYELRLTSKRPDPPCKHWRDKMIGVVFLATLERIWAQNLEEWAIKHPYLASPTAPCECNRCMKPGIAKALPPADEWGFDQPMQLPGSIVG